MKSSRLLLSSVPEQMKLPSLVSYVIRATPAAELDHSGIAGHVKVTVRGVRLHFRRERALGDDARIIRRVPRRSRFRLEAAGRSAG